MSSVELLQDHHPCRGVADGFSGETGAVTMHSALRAAINEFLHSHLSGVRLAAVSTIKFPAIDLPTPMFMPIDVFQMDLRSCQIWLVLMGVEAHVRARCLFIHQYCIRVCNNPSYGLDHLRDDQMWEFIRISQLGVFLTIWIGWTRWRQSC